MAPKSSKTKSTKKTSKVTNKSVTKTALKHKGKKLMKNKVVKKVVKKVAAKKVAAKTVAETKIKKVRSFKVQLPDSEKYEGRFTGLTPYQAANKALSKYYREQKQKQKKKKGKITFSIKESTRGSKRLVYHYNGYREKLKVPVEYAIKSGDETRIITKNFKNKLNKIKKAELAALNLA